MQEEQRRVDPVEPMPEIPTPPLEECGPDPQQEPKQQAAPRKKQSKAPKEKQTKEKLTTTKQILYLVLVVWIGSLIFSAGSWVFRGTHPTGLMNSVNTVAVPTILSYAVKSGFEFVTRMKNGLFTTETK